MTQFRSREAQAFRAGLEDPERTQAELLLRQIVAPNADCEFGREHGFSAIQTVADFQSAVPIATYDAFAPRIERIVERGEQGLLTTAPVKRFFMTSGSMARSKHIPVTSWFVRQKSRAFGVFWAAVFEDHPDAKAGRMVTNFSDSGGSDKTPGGLPSGSESSFWAGVTRATQLSREPIVPKAVAQIADTDERYFAIARILLRQQFAVIMTLNPSTIVLLLQTLQRRADDLIAEVEHADAARGEQLRALQADDRFVAHALWPSLRLAICWRSPMLQPYIDLLEPHLRGVAQRDYILMASEGIMAVPLHDGGSGGPIAVGVHFYEFVPLTDLDRPDPRVLLPHELELGECYVVVVTNGAGLYRYNIGDVVRVNAFEGRTPCVEFLHRVGATSSLSGEKLTEDQVTAAMRQACDELCIATPSFTVAPAPEGFPRYAALVEWSDAAPAQRSELPGRFDAALAQINTEYASKRSSRRLGAPEVWVVGAGEFARARQRRIDAGTSDSQIKPVHLTRDRAAALAFEVVERIGAG